MYILIAEDDLISRKLLFKILERFGEVHVAINGREAIQEINWAILDNRPYDLVILDIMMPGIHGQDVLVKLRQLEKEKGIPEARAAVVIMLTAMADMDNVQQALNAGCNAYILKPLQPKSLIDKMIELGVVTMEEGTAAD